MIDFMPNLDIAFRVPRPRWSWLLVLLIAAANPTVRAVVPFDVTVATEMTDAGRRFVRPTPEHPTYYVEVYRAFDDQGKPWGSGDPEAAPLPPLETVKSVVEESLSKQDYFPAVIKVTPGSGSTGAAKSREALAGQPSLILNIRWGYVRPQTSLGPDSATPTDRLNDALQFAGGNLQDAFTIDLIGLKTSPPKFGELNSALYLPRYYIIIDAYDYQAYASKAKHPLLWRTKMSVLADSLSVTFSGTLQPMLAAGGPAFGQDVPYPIHEIMPQGTVIIGKPVVIQPSR